MKDIEAERRALEIREYKRQQRELSWALHRLGMLQAEQEIQVQALKERS